MENLGSAPHVAQRVPWADVAQVKGPTGGRGNMALREVCAGRELQVADGGAAGNNADSDTSCFQGAELRANVDRLVDVTDWVVDDGAGRASTASRGSWLEDQGGIRGDGVSTQVISATCQAPDGFRADVGRVGPD